MTNSSYNPDVLNCIANLSNDEVFTPPELANKMLDLLPQELFHSPKTTFLDPFTKSGVFLREIVKRLDRGLADQMPDRQQRIDHILHHQVFGIACTELTSLLARRSVYCSKTANGPYSISKFDTPAGNILYRNIRHTWVNGKCKYCGASQTVYDRGSEAEQYAYMFIHTDNPKQFFPNMKFDVIVGNPPYQLSDSGFGISAKPIYDMFITQAKRLRPRYISVIVPARWYAGGKGLDDFRDEMLHDNHLRIIHDYPQAYECFAGVQIKGGVCYFLWDRDHPGLCNVVTHKDNKESRPKERPLLEEGCDTFIRYNEAVSILHKVLKQKETSMMDFVSSRQPFGLDTTYHGKDKGKIKLYENKGVSYIDESVIEKNNPIVAKYKVFIPRASSGSDTFPHPILGRPFIGEPFSACTETYMFIGPYKNNKECNSVISYIQTRFFRFLVMLKKVTQDTTKSVYQFVPLQDFSHPWTDEMLYKKYGLTDEEIAFIESMIRPME
ncbi:MAG: Eco57I restriction-modification methylase domain-containing protein [Bacteroidaceae bacterium]|nr:Eco57I restriction-modification methylase domain-containing protein [Bacteroidaceae bacterium]